MATPRPTDAQLLAAYRAGDREAGGQRSRRFGGLGLSNMSTNKRKTRTMNGYCMSCRTRHRAGTPHDEELPPPETSEHLRARDTRTKIKPAGLAALEAPPVLWDGMVSNYTADELGDLVRFLERVSEHAARMSGYFGSMAATLKLADGVVGAVRAARNSLPHVEPNANDCPRCILDDAVNAYERARFAADGRPVVKVAAEAGGPTAVHMEVKTWNDAGYISSGPQVIPDSIGDAVARQKAEMEAADARAARCRCTIERLRNYDIQPEPCDSEAKILGSTSTDESEHFCINCGHLYACHAPATATT